MITLITGLPGLGKTLSVVSDLAKRLQSDWAGRKVFTHGIKDLTIPVESIPDGHTINDMHVWLKDERYKGSIIIIDECQTVFPPRSSGSKTPDLVDWLHVHRHFGVDLILITQMPSRIDKQVRDLVGAHYHIHKNPLGVRMRYYWDYCANNPLSELKNGRPEIYKLDKNAFKLYKSAEVHTKIKTPKTRVLWLLPLCLLAFFAFSFMGYKNLSKFSTGGQSDSVAASNSSVSDVVESGVSNGANSVSAQAGEKILADKKRDLKPEMFEPTIPGLVESKPIYNDVRRVQQFEYPVACVAGGKSGCSCYSSQGTPIKEIDKKTCVDYATNGLPFNPYKDKPRVDTKPVVYDVPQSQVLVMGGQSQQNLMYDGYNDARPDMQSGAVVGAN
ncbi:zonular occludens toxin [Neisseria sp. N95_16]|uniref:Zonular occludens toxin n=1 Tax=Neisseria brasiliensis TaxID=2666100 RepID=A0A7X2H0E7_9NEIS|nr:MULTISPECIES: zonular occludens toxin domain-containing protein [Neisseria]MRN39305.1 zonular occludens toxin [Neisseria brasiliensis]PJO09603.1 zonular occludens toxin [Neisseria sp. N95_16]